MSCRPFTVPVLHDSVTGHEASIHPLREIVFVDGGLDDVTVLSQLACAHRTFNVLDPARDGLQQTLAHLKGKKELGAIHLVGHGRLADQRIGTTVLSPDLIEYESESFKEIGASLNKGGAILFYDSDSSEGDLDDEVSYSTEPSARPSIPALRHHA